MTETDSGNAESTGSNRPNFIPIAAGMLRNDQGILLPMLVFLSIPVLLEVGFDISGIALPLAPVLVNRLFQIAVVSFVVLRWRQRLQSNGQKPLSPLPVIGRITIVSVVISIVLLLPMFAAMGLGGGGLLIFVFLMGLGILWAYRMYLFFAVAGLLGVPLLEGMSKSATLIKGNAKEFGRSLLAPCAYTMLLVGACQIPYPDGRSLGWLVMGSVAEGVFWILSAYTGLALALILLSDSDWRLAGLDAYRTERLDTLSKQGGTSLTGYLSPRFAIGMLAVAVLIWGGNLMRQFHQPPAATIAIKNISIEDYKIKLALQVRDDEYDFRGFQPFAFSIQTATGEQQIGKLESVARVPEQDERKDNLVIMLTKDDGPVADLYLTFSSTKTKASLSGLDNMWIWYKLKPLMAVSPDLLKKIPS
jgi:hypothetical protein